MPALMPALSKFDFPEPEWITYVVGQRDPLKPRVEVRHYLMVNLIDPNKPFDIDADFSSSPHRCDATHFSSKETALAMCQKIGWDTAKFVKIVVKRKS